MVWQSLPASMNRRAVSKFTGGINNLSNPLELKDEETTDETGIDTFNYPIASVRKGRTSYGASGVAVTHLITNLSNIHLVRAVGTKLQYNSSGTTWSDIPGTFADTDWTATNFDDGGPVLVLTNGIDTPRLWDGTNLTTMSGSPPKGKYCTADPSRVWMAESDVIHYSSFQNLNDWTSTENSGSVQYFTFKGGDITALYNYNNLKCVWKKESFAVIYGVNSFDFRLVEVSNNIGCISDKTVQEVNGRLFWLGQQDVYSFTQGLPTPIGEKIRGFLNNINQSYLDKCFAGTDGLRYYLGLVVGSSTEPNVMCVYDTRYSKWRVYDQNIPQLRYSGYFKGRWYCGNAYGQTYLMNDGTTDDGEPISWYMITKPFDEDFREAEKEYWEGHLQGYIPTETTVAFSVSTNDRGIDFTNIDSLSGSSYSENGNFIIPMDTVPLTNWLRIKLSGNGYAEINEVQRWFRVQPVQY